MAVKIEVSVVNAIAAKPEIRSIGSVIGLILIATGVAVFRDQDFPGWWALLPPALHLAGWGLRRFPAGPRLLGAVGVGAAAAVAAVTIGPLAGILTAAAGAVVLLTALADGVAEATGDLASTLDR